MVEEDGDEKYRVEFKIPWSPTERGLSRPEARRKVLLLLTGLNGSFVFLSLIPGRRRAWKETRDMALRSQDKETRWTEVVRNFAFENDSSLGWQ